MLYVIWSNICSLNLTTGHQILAPGAPELCVSVTLTINLLHIFVYLGFYVAFNTVQVISRRVVGRAEETST